MMSKIGPGFIRAAPQPVAPMGSPIGNCPMSVATRQRMPLSVRANRNAGLLARLTGRVCAEGRVRVRRCLCTWRRSQMPRQHPLVLPLGATLIPCRRCPSGCSSVYGCAMRLCGMIIMIVIGVVLSTGAALAHVSDHREQTSARQIAVKSIEAEDPAPVARAECRWRTNVTSSEMLFEAHFGTGQRDARVDGKALDDSNLDDDCCGTTCHAAVGDKGNDKVALRRPSSPAVLVVASVLLGADQGRLERPPRYV